MKAKCPVCRVIGEVHPDTEVSLDEGAREGLESEILGRFSSRKDFLEEGMGEEYAPWENASEESPLGEGEDIPPKGTPEDKDFEDFFEESGLDLSIEDVDQIREEILSRPEAKPPAARSEFIAPAISIADRETAGLAPRYGLFHGNPLANILAGIMVGFSTYLACLAFASLIFAQTLPAAYFSHGLTIVLIGAVLLGLAMAVDTTLPAMAAGPEVVSAVAVWTLAASISQGMQGRFTDQEIFQTIFAAIALAGLSLGVVTYVIGRLKGATWLRFIPYQVLAGLVLGAALLLIKGAYDLSLSAHPGLVHIPGLWGLEGILAWLPAFMLGLLLYLILWRRPNPLPFLILITAGIGLSLWLLPRYAAPYFSIPSRDWFMPSEEVFRFWDIYSRDMFRHVQWPVILEHAGYFLAIIGMVTGTALVKLIQLESSLGRGADMNREYATLGLGNIMSGAAGGMPGSISLYRSLGLSSLGGQGALASLAMVFTTGWGLYVAPVFAAVIPRWMPPALLVFFGLRLVKRTMWDFRSAYTRQGDYLVLFSVAGFILVLGLPLGVALSLLLALVTMLIRSGQVNPIRHALSGGQYRSKVDRPPAHMDLLNEQGAVIFILRLQGYLFLGSFQSIAAEVRTRFLKTELPSLQYLILDFSRVVGLDSSIGLGLATLKRMARENDFQLVLTNLPLEQEQRMERGGLKLNDPDQNCRTYLDLDYALEWTENQVLEDAGYDLGSSISPEKRIAEVLSLAESSNRLGCYLEKVRAKSGNIILKQGEFSNALYFVEQGNVAIRLTLQDGSIFRLRKLGPGSVFGEMGIYTAEPRSATVIAEDDCLLYRLTQENMKRLRREDPDLMQTIDHFIINHLAARVREGNAMLREVIN